MIEKRIDHIAYQLKQNKNNGQPGAIVFIGAGCSKSAGIPLANEIIVDVLQKYRDHPDITCLGDNPSYSEIMRCLGPRNRKEIFEGYVDKAKINVSHIYLAQLMKEGFVDYIVTVNFDNLALRALALYNIFPSTYDISVLNSMDLSTTSLDTKSVIYLHGQFNGLWQLNTQAEMDKIIQSNVAYDIFNKITTNRPWIVIGYKGDDFIFDQLIQLRRFYDGLYWVGYKDNDPTEKVQKELLDKTNKESFWVKGYDADSFFLKLNSELGETDPGIIGKPFSFLSELQDSIIDIEEGDFYKAVKERLTECKKMVKDAINKYEKLTERELAMTDAEIKRAQLIKALINCQTSNNYEELATLEAQIDDKSDIELVSILANIYYNWGCDLGESTKLKTGKESESLFIAACEKYKRATELKSDYHEAYNNWGTAFGNLAEKKSGEESETLYKQAFEKFGKAIEIKPDKHEAYNNWGTYLGKLAEIKTGEESETLYKQAFEKFRKAIEFKPDFYLAYFNWGTALGRLVDKKDEKEAEALYTLAFEKFRKATELNSNNYEVYYNWGTLLGKLIDTKSGEEFEILCNQAFEKFEKAIKIKPDGFAAYYNWGLNLSKLAETKLYEEAESFYKKVFQMYIKAAEINSNDYATYYNWGNSLAKLACIKTGKESELLFHDAEVKLRKAVELGGKVYNLACLLALSKRIAEAFNALENSLQKNEESFEYVENDSDWDGLREESEYKRLKEKYSKK